MVDMTDMQKLAERIAEHLDGWTATRQGQTDWGVCRYATLVNDSAEIVLYYDSYRKRVSCSGRYPRRSGSLCSARDWGVIPYGEAEIEIKFSATRDPKALAHDIERRFLPTYMERFAACVEKSREHAASEEDRETYLKRYATACGGEVRGETIHIWFDRTDGGTIYGDAHVACDGSVRFEDLSVTPQMAEAIFALLGAAK